MDSVLQDWVMNLPRRFQGTLLTAVRGCDLEPKQWDDYGDVVDTPGRRLTAWLRWCFMNPADEREVGIHGAFFQCHPPDEPFKPSAFGHLPQHWYAHVMHSLEIVGYCHPNQDTRRTANRLYAKMVRNLHLKPETEEEMYERLTEDRIANDSVVS